MSNAIITSDYLVSPSSCQIEDVENAIADLIKTKSLMQFLHQCFIEDNALEGLIERGLYPTDNLFKKNLAACKFDGYSANDLAKLVNSMLATMQSVSVEVPEYATEWGDKKFDPALKNIELSRKSELECLIERLSLENHLGNSQFALMHYCHENNVKDITLSGVINEIFPQDNITPPLELNIRIPLFRRITSYLAQLDAYSYFANAEQPNEFKFAFFVCTLNRLRVLGKSLTEIELEDFSFGNKFLESLKMNQCMPGQKFGSTLLEKLSEVLANRQSDQFTIFATEKGGSTARKSKGYTAYREHVTKGGVGLRLMFWRNDSGHIIFSNVGPKQELSVYIPE